MSGLGAIADNIERTITLSDRTKSLDSSLINDNNDITKLTNGEACLTSNPPTLELGSSCYQMGNPILGPCWATYPKVLESIGGLMVVGMWVSGDMG